MQIAFTRNERATVGVELELMVVDRQTGELANVASKLLAEMGEQFDDGLHPKAKHELFECTVEIITGVCENADEARADLQATLDELARVADAYGYALISSGSHPFGRVTDQIVSPSERYAQLIEDMQWAARRLLIFGTHVHVGVRDGERAIATANELQRQLPLLLALSASSPYWESTDTGLASARTKVFESLPTAGLPPQLDGWSDFEAFMRTLIDSGCIKTIREVWWDIRPHPEFGTVELRMCDAVSNLDEAAALAAISQALVVQIGERLDAGEQLAKPREWTVRENKWLAARYGMDARLIVDEEGTRLPARDLIADLITDLRPVADRYGSGTHLDHALSMADRPGYVRQRDVLRTGGTPADVVRRLADELGNGQTRTS
ncbi:MAG: glutamate--cysteine ligase [Actinomycetota bacterium]